MRPRCYHFTQCVGVKVAVSTNVTCLPAGFKSFREGMYIYLATWTTLNLPRYALPFLLSIVMSVKVARRERSPENLTATSSNCWTANPPAQGRKDSINGASRLGRHMNKTGTDRRVNVTSHFSSLVLSYKPLTPPTPS